ncbi:LysR substrate-binding domain-containing protein [Ectopseudomonas mendocina]|uniref:LysR substrate-binding domain-containing protein n=1 Tax=Ectopseudomonas mendocina TaxID=300 RepID=A0ABZ2RII6_ECTME
MDFKQLRYFIAVAEELHFGRAAARLFISQPALSFDIKKLEEQLGVQLLIRNNKSVKLTSAGETLLSESRTLLVQLEQVKRLTLRSSQGLSGRLRIGFVNSMLHRGLPEAIACFQQENPGIEVVLVEMNTAEQAHALQRGQIDLGLVHWGRISPGIASELLMTDPFIACLPESHPLAGSCRLTLSELNNDGFIMFPRASSPHYHDLIVALCVSSGFSPIIRHEARLWQTIITMVGLGMGVALVPQTLADAWPADVRYVEIERPDVRSETHAIYMDGAASQAAKDFLGTLRQCLPGESKVTD